MEKQTVKGRVGQLNMLAGSRKVWAFSPVTKIVKSKKTYSRKNSRAMAAQERV